MTTETKVTAGKKVEVTNTWEQIARSGGGVAICYTSMNGRGLTRQDWTILRIDAKGREVVTDPTAAWWLDGKKAFTLFEARTNGSTTLEDKAAALAKALAWIKEQYGIDEPYVRNRMGDMIPKRVNNAFPLRKRSKL